MKRELFRILAFFGLGMAIGFEVIALITLNGFCFLVGLVMGLLACGSSWRLHHGEWL